MKERAPRNRTLTIEDHEKDMLLMETITLNRLRTRANRRKVINQDIFSCIDLLPDNFIYLLVIDPPYNLNKKPGEKISKKSADSYQEWLESYYPSSRDV